jgi:hypothetical protein
VSECAEWRGWMWKRLIVARVLLVAVGTGKLIYTTSIVFVFQIFTIFS